jgi:hypothetical protein
LTLLLLLVVLPGAAVAQDRDDDPLVVITGSVKVEEGVTVDDVFVINGDTRIDGTVSGDVAVLSGRVEIAGRVDGDVFAAAGEVEVLAGGEVGGDLRYGDEDKRPVISSRATVGGDVSHEGWDDIPDALPWLGAAALWLAVTISALVLGLILVLLFPRAADVVYAQSRARLALAVAFGLAAFIAVPIAAALAAATLVGIPLALALALALLPLAATAYVTAAWALGRRLVKGGGSRVVAFLAGLAILRALALIPVLGVLVWLAAVVVGLGLLIAAAGATRTGRGAADAPVRSTEAGR